MVGRYALDTSVCYTTCVVLGVFDLLLFVCFAFHTSLMIHLYCCLRGLAVPSLNPGSLPFPSHVCTHAQLSRQTGGMRKLNFPQVTELYFLWVTNWNSLACVTLVYVPHIFHAIGNQFTLVYFYCLTPLFPRGHLCTKVTWLTDRYYCRPRTLLVSMATSLTNLQTSIIHITFCVRKRGIYVRILLL